MSTDKCICDFDRSCYITLPKDYTVQMVPGVHEHLSPHSLLAEWMVALSVFWQCNDERNILEYINLHCSFCE